jgi:competence ComEA-like helix-hairpin-helix protein
MNKKRGSILVGVLWCLALLAVVVIGVLHTVRMDLMVTKNQSDVIQAHYLALAGIEKAKALLYDDAASRKRSGTSHSAQLYDDPQDFKEVPFGKGDFSVFHQGGENEGSKVVYGISDEEGRLNLNGASQEELLKLYGMRPETAAAILDWIDEDNNVRPGGAESDFYASLKPPYLPRNGAMTSVRELLMVSGVDRELFLGEDANGNGLLDPEEDDGDENYPPDNHDGILDFGWSGLLTVDSWVENRNAAGEERVNVQTADESALMKVKGISSEIAKAVVAYRGQNRLESIADLLDVAAAAPQPASQGQPQAQGQGQSPSRSGGRPTVRAVPVTPAPTTSNAPNTPNTPGQPAQTQPPVQFTGPKLIDQNLLMEIGDDVTASTAFTQTGAININTASQKVLICLPGITEEMAQAIVNYRESSGPFANIAMLLQVPNMTREIFKQVVPRITVRSETYRILSEGRIKSSGVRQRIQMIVHVSSSDVETLSYREDL